jgi:hypothetical protein
MLRKSNLTTRNQLPLLLNEKGLLGTAVEVGTHQGDYASIFLERWEGNMLVCVDPWHIPPGYEHQMKFLWGDKNRDNDFQTCMDRLSRYEGRYCMMRMISVKASEHFEDHSLDFVYLDGDHRYKEVLKDLRAWWPKLKMGGILAGHDVIMPNQSAEDDWPTGVQGALDAFFGLTTHHYDINLIVEEDGLPWSFYLEKTHE